MYMIAEAIVLTKGPSEFHLSQGVLVSLNIILGLQVSIYFYNNIIITMLLMLSLVM